MADVFDPQKRSWIMSRVRSENTRPELLVRSMVHKMGFRFRLHNKALPGKPDLTLARHKAVIFVHGCFWHGHPDCPKSARPTSNTAFWDKKISGNLERDRKNQQALEALGWRYLIIWECEIRKTEELAAKIQGFLRTDPNPA